MFLASLFFALPLTSVLVSVSLVVEPRQLPGNTSSQCELHIWPAERLDGTAFSLYNGLIRGRASGKEIEGAMEELLTPSSQITALREIDFVHELNLTENTKIIEHLEPVNHKTDNKIKSRRVKSSSNCYSELFIMQHWLVEDIVWGDRFISIFSFRDFQDRPYIIKTVKGDGGNKLKVFTQTETSRPFDAPQLVAAALRANFLEYSKKARKKLPRPVMSNS